MKKSAKQIVNQNIDSLKTMTAKEIESNFSDIFANGISRNNFKKALYKIGVNFDEMNFIENSTEFTVIDKYSNGQSTKKVIHNSELNNENWNNKFYPFCSKVFLTEKIIHILPCEYNHNGYAITPVVEFAN